VIILTILILSVDFVCLKFSVDYFKEQTLDGLPNQDHDIKNGPLSSFSFLQKDNHKNFEEIEDFIQKKVRFYLIAFELKINLRPNKKIKWILKYTLKQLTASHLFK